MQTDNAFGIEAGWICKAWEEKQHPRNKNGRFAHLVSDGHIKLAKSGETQTIEFGPTRLKLGPFRGRKGKGVYMLDVYTVEKHRGHGASTRLIKSAMKAADRQGIMIYTDPEMLEGEAVTTKLLAWYQHLGFKLDQTAVDKKYAGTLVYEPR